MPFGQKNVGDTYINFMIVILHDLIHIIMEDYLNVFLGKCKTQEEHPQILEHIFNQLEQY